MSLKSLNSMYEVVVDRGDGTYVALHRLMFHWTMLVGLIEDEYGYDNRYCYATFEKAQDGLNEWQARDWEGEPMGWHRNPPTSRRRVDGDPATEYIAP